MLTTTYGLLAWPNQDHQSFVRHESKCKGARLDSRGAEAFHYAVHSPNPERTFRVLLKRGANPNAKDKHGVHALPSACQYGLGWSIQFFLDYGADIRDTTATGLTPLHYCVWGNCQSVFDILVDKGIEVNNGANDLIWFPIHYASYSGSLSIAKSLLELGCSLDVSDKNGRHLFIWHVRKDI